MHTKHTTPDGVGRGPRRRFRLAIGHFFGRQPEDDKVIDLRPYLRRQELRRLNTKRPSGDAA